MELGEELGRGVRSVVYAWGELDVVKVANPSTPDAWLVDELRLMDIAERAGAAMPARRRLVDVDGRRALAMERIVGPSMWDLLVEDPSRAPDLGGRLALVQAELASCSPSYEMPAQRSRIVSKIHAAARRYGEELLAALDHLPPDEGPLVLCHGDLHPRNVLLAERGAVLVDWYDASRGLIGVEIARTVLMLDVSSALGPSTAPSSASSEMREHYLAAACELAGVRTDEIERWHLVQDVARLAEGIGDRHVLELRERLAGLSGRPDARSSVR